MAPATSKPITNTETITHALFCDLTKNPNPFFHKAILTIYIFAWNNFTDFIAFGYFFQLNKPGKIFEVPISFNGRSKNEGKKLRLRDGITAIWTLIKYRFVD
jgi:hypothetical protein